MSQFTKQTVLALIAIIQWVMAWDPAPKDEAAARLAELQASLDAHSAPLAEAQAKITTQ